MKIMTFNTQHCRNFITGKIDFQKMADTIIQHDPDIVGLNEMRGKGIDKGYEAQVEILASLTGMKYFYFAKAIDISGKGPYGNGILSKFPILNAKTVMIPDPEKRMYSGYYETRCIIKAEIEGGITVLVTHMGLNPDEQTNAVFTALEHISDKKCILMGDFNMIPSCEILHPVFERMTDTGEKISPDKMSFPSDLPNCKIDYIFVSRDVNVESADIPDVIASDHRPVIATLTI